MWDWLPFSNLNFTIYNMKVGSGNLFQLNYLCSSDGRGFVATLYAAIVAWSLDTCHFFNCHLTLYASIDAYKVAANPLP